MHQGHTATLISQLELLQRFYSSPIPPSRFELHFLRSLIFYQNKRKVNVVLKKLGIGVKSYEL
jgi:hypothetical protein